MKRLSLLLMLAPALLVIIALFLGGLMLGLLQSVSYMPVIGLNDFSLDAYKSMFTDSQFLGSLALTFGLSVITTFLTIVFAIITALALRKTFIGKRIVNFLYQFPITIPHLVIAIGIMLLFSQSGYFSRVAHAFGFIKSQSDFPILVYDDLGIGIVLVYLWKQIPFVGLIVLSVLQSSGNDFEELARSLGANGWQTFRHVLLPLIIPGILPASIICFAFVFGSYEVPYLLGKPYPAVLSVLAYRLYEDTDLNSRPEAMAMFVFIAVFISILVLVYKKIVKTISGRND
jgi:putative spermidine/putrescine transport system permease protein